MSATAARDCIWRARRAGLAWPLPADLTDEELECRLYPPPTVAASNRRPQPEWAAVHRELRRPGVTLQLLWEEHRAVHPDGYGYSRYVAAKFMLRERLCFDGSPEAGAVLTQHNPVSG
jgi:transposase